MASPITVDIEGKYKDAEILRAMRDLKKLQTQGLTLSGKMTAVGASLQAMGQSVAKVGKGLTVGVTLPIVGVGVAATKMAMDFDTSLTKMVSLVGLTRDEVDGMRGDIITMASQYGKSAKEAADALFFITSAGLRGSDAIDTLEASLKGAAVGLGDVQTIADLATSAMNAYGPSNLSASNATDILANAVREGKLESTELAGAMGQVLPIASAMGVGFDEVGAAMAAMSRTGTNAAQASTQLRSIMTSILKPTVKAEKAMAGMGLSSEGLRKQIREEGLLSVLQTLSKEFDGNDAAAAAVFGNVRALSGVMDLMGENADTTAQIFGNLTESTGILDEAMGVAAETTGFKLQKAFATLKNSLIEFGDIIAPFVAQFAERIATLGQAFQNLSPQMKQFIVAGLGIAAAIGPVVLIVGKLLIVVGSAIKLFAAITLAGSLLAIKIIAVVAVIALIVAAFKLAFDNSEVLRDAVSQLIGTVQRIAQVMQQQVLGAFKAVTGQSSSFGDVLRTVGRVLGVVFAKAINVVTGLLKVLGGAAQVSFKIFEVGVTVLRMVAEIIRAGIIITLDILLNKLGPISTRFRAMAEGIRSAFTLVASVVSGVFNNLGAKVAAFINLGIGAINALIDAYNKVAEVLRISHRATRIAEFQFQSLTGATNANTAALGGNRVASGFNIRETERLAYQNSALAGIIGDMVVPAYDASGAAAAGAGIAAGGAGSAAKKAGEDAKEAAKKYRESFEDIRTKLTASVDDIKAKMADMATSVSSSLMRGFNLGETEEKFGENGERIGGTFIEKLQAQADKVVGFAARIKELMNLGLDVNSPLMQAVIAEGATPSGLAIAQSLIDSGAEGINQATGMLTAAQGAADEIGLLAAGNFFQAGLDSAQQTVNAFVSIFGAPGKGRKRLMTMMDNLAAAMKRETTITVTTINRVVTQAVGGSGGRVAVGATGGIVNRPTFALIGEAGPEAVIPLDRTRGNSALPSMGGGGMGTTINLTVNAGIGTDGAEVGRRIVDAIKQYERRNGAVYVSA